MKCCVHGCRNDTRRISKNDGITFHVFPLDPTLRSAWLSVLHKGKWVPKDRSTVCSDHFRPDDMYMTKTGLRRVRKGALPRVFGEKDVKTLRVKHTLKACRVCLETDTELYPLKKYNMEKEFEHVTGLSVLYEKLRLPQMICVECAKRLLNCSYFRRKSLRTNDLMLELVKKHGFLTPDIIKSIDRDTHDLKSQLSIKTFEPNFFNIQINEIDGETKSIEVQNGNEDRLFIQLPEIDCVKDEIEIESINDDSIEINNIDANSVSDESDIITLKQENFNTENVVNNTEIAIDNNIENENIDTNIENENNVTNIENVIIDTNIENVMIDANTQTFTDAEKKEAEKALDGNSTDDNYTLSDKDYSSDDSLPLMLAKSKKRKVKKKETKTRCKRKKNPVQIEPKIDRRRKPFLTDDLSETLFTITDLSMEEQLAEIDKRKYSSNYNNGVFKCNECYKGFLDETAFNSHMARHTTACGEFRCNVCKTHFKFSRALRKHVTAHHTQKFSCNLCPYVTSHRQSARLHERWHKGTQYKCPHCAEVFVKFTTYMGHIRIKHPSDFVCQLCGYSFVSEKGILLHTRLKHRLETVTVPEDGPLCEPCNVRFINHEALKRHISVSARHNNAEKDAREPNKPGYKPKKRRETGERETRDSMSTACYKKSEGPIPCEQCGLQLEDSRAYHSHFRRMHPDKNRTQYPSMRAPCMCEVCGKMFQSQALLKDHRWLHTNECPFKCESCGKTFRMKQRLVAHRHVHSAEKATYDCGLCGKPFSSQSNRQRHMFIHTGLKPFKCEMCGKGFKHISEKRSHIAYVHLKKPWPKRSRGKRRSDGRQGSIPGQQMNQSSDIEMQPMWSDPKMDGVTVMM